jgi:hypothetical protein
MTLVTTAAAQKQAFLRRDNLIGRHHLVMLRCGILPFDIIAAEYKYFFTLNPA